MEQILLIQPTTPQTPQIRNGAGDGQGNFSSHLNTAINDRAATHPPQQGTDRNRVTASNPPELTDDTEGTAKTDQSVLAADPEDTADTAPLALIPDAEDTVDTDPSGLNLSAEGIATPSLPEAGKPQTIDADFSSIIEGYILSLFSTSTSDPQELLPSGLREMIQEGGHEPEPGLIATRSIELETAVRSLLTELLFQFSSAAPGATDENSKSQQILLPPGLQDIVPSGLFNFAPDQNSETDINTFAERLVELRAVIRSVLAEFKQAYPDQIQLLSKGQGVPDLLGTILQNFPEKAIGTFNSEVFNTSILQNKESYEDAGGTRSNVRQDQLVSQLQKIIDNSSETGTVTISRSMRSTVSFGGVWRSEQPSSSMTAQQQFTVAGGGDKSAATITVSSYATPEEFNQSKTDNKQKQDLSGIRADVKQQFYDAKIGGRENFSNSAENQGGTKDSDTLNQPGQQTTGSAQVNGPAPGSGEQANTFAQTVTGIQETPITTTSEAAKPVIPFTSNLTHEQEVLQQLIDKFQVNFRKPETNLSIKLHPAELGELKIDLTVKEGAIRANVVAQSQHVQEILERNLPRLKTILENQGFTVDQILIASESESAGRFDLFDSNLFNGRNDTYSPRNKAQQSFSSFVSEAGDLTESTIAPGVNVTA